MKKLLVGASLLVALTTPAPSHAQLVVHDPLNYVQQVLQLYELYEEVEAAYTNLERLDEDIFNEYLVGLLEEAALEQGFGSAISYAKDDGKFLMDILYPGSYIPAADADLEAYQLAELWSKVGKDTYAGSVGAANRHYRDLEEMSARLETLRALSRGAHGNQQQHQANSQWAALQVDSQLQANSLMQSLLNVLAVDATTQNALRSHEQRAYREATTGWLGGELTPIPEQVNPPEPMPIVPDGWPFPVFGGDE